MRFLKRLTAAALSAALVLSMCVSALAAESAESAVTRGEAADMILAAAQDYNAGVSLDDVMRGDGTGALRTESACTRAEALIMLSRAFGGLPVPKGDNARSGYPVQEYTDVPSWAEGELADVFTSGIVSGTEEGLFLPGEPVTKAELERYIHRTYALLGSNLKDDFYASVNKTELDESELRPGYTAAGVFTDLGIEVSEEVAQIIREVVADPKTEGERKLANLYANILDKDAREAAGIEPIRGYIDAALSAATVRELAALDVTMLRESGTTCLLGFGLTADAKDSEHYLPFFAAVSPALGVGGYEAASEQQKAAYLRYVETLYGLLGISEERAAQMAQLIWTADSAAAAVSMTNQELSDVDNTYNIYTLSELEALFPEADLRALFDAYGLRNTDRIQVYDPEAVKAVAALFVPEQLETLRAYVLLGTAENFGTCLNAAFDDAVSAFNQEYLGMAGQLSDEEKAAQYVQSLMSDYLGQAYVERCFSAEAKADVEQMTREIIAAYESRIGALDWMSAETKEKAVDKLQAITLRIGYPDEWTDSLADVPIRSAAEGGSFLENLTAMRLAQVAKLAGTEDETVDKDEWLLAPYTVNAYYDPNANSINFPAAILQPPFYDVNAPREENLGGIGYVIAHEITHAFDNNGAKFDKNGNAADWWTAEDYAAFQELCGRVIALYDGRETAPGIFCDGALTISENIADLGAVACITQLAGERQDPDYQALYTAAAKIWCSSYTREYRQYLALFDVHAPDKLRGSLVFLQFPSFYEAFGIDEDDGMWLDPSERVVVW